MFHISALFNDLNKTFKLALPMVLGQVIALSMSFVDAAMLGRGVGTESLAALGFGMNIVQIFAVSGFGFTAAVSILVSQAWGAGKSDTFIPLLRHGIVASFLYALAMLAGLVLFMENLPLFHNLGQPEHVVELAKPYVYLISAAFIFTYHNSATRSYCQGQSIVWFPLAILSSTILLNICFNWIFIFGKCGVPPMGLLGAGIGSLLSQVGGTLLITTLLHRSRRYRYNLRELCRPEITFKELRQMFSLGFPLYLEILGEVSGLAVIAFMVGTLGDAPLAAHHGASEISILSYIIVMATSNAAAIRIGQARGAGDAGLLLTIKHSSFLFSAFIGLLFTVGLIALRWQLPYIYTRDPEVVAISATIFIFMGAYQLIDMMAVMAAGLLNGMGYVKIPMAASILGKFLIMVPVGYLLGFRLGWGVPGLWAAISAGIYAFGCVVVLRAQQKIRHHDIFL